jgi:hypothetical protein
MPVSATLASQELLRLSPKSRSPRDVFSANEGGGVAAPQGILTAFSAGPGHGSLATPSGPWGEGTCSQTAAASTSESQGDSRQHGLRWQGDKQGLGFWPEFIYPVVTSPLLLSTLSP